MQSGIATDVDAQRETDERRRVLITELANAERTLNEKTLPALNREYEAAKFAVDEARTAFAAAIGEMNRCDTARSVAIHAVRRQREAIQQELHSTAPECITRWVADLQEDLRVTESKVSSEGAWGARQTLIARAKVIRALLDDADALRLSCVSEADAMRRIQALQATLPKG